MGKIIWIEFIVTDINGFSIIGDDVARIRSEEASLFVHGGPIDFQRFYRKELEFMEKSGKTLPVKS